MLDILNYIMINQCKISALASRFVFLAFDYIMLLSPLQWMNQWAAEFAGFQFVLLASKRTSIVDRMKSNNPPGPSRRLQTRNHAQQPLARSRPPPPPPLLPHTEMQNLTTLTNFHNHFINCKKNVADAESCAASFPKWATSTPAAHFPPCPANCKNISSQTGFIFNEI